MTFQKQPAGASVCHCLRGTYYWEWQLSRAEKAVKQGVCLIMRYKIENIETDV